MHHVQRREDAHIYALQLTRDTDERQSSDYDTDGQKHDRVYWYAHLWQQRKQRRQRRSNSSRTVSAWVIVHMHGWFTTAATDWTWITSTVRFDHALLLILQQLGRRGNDPGTGFRITSLVLLMVKSYPAAGIVLASAIAWTCSDSRSRWRQITNNHSVETFGDDVLRQDEHESAKIRMHEIDGRQLNLRPSRCRRR
jgi:hypothetical protein